MTRTAGSYTFAKPFGRVHCPSCSGPQRSLLFYSVQGAPTSHQHRWHTLFWIRIGIEALIGGSSNFFVAKRCWDEVGDIEEHAWRFVRIGGSSSSKRR